ncbi:hypothetical protein RclHR1_00450045 [Rhizophagus clarus]|uniref:SMP domain-containing protein n=1 Tax=Rhizophagus clarus TaxID=94130 RepID=A0A2Z6RZA2_9GLOM|nr:hypothetical protein RclHR1_00450045 [Rhizophagus clarus]GES73684.1 hypothetical protein RCL_jg26144.t1 [Rhizophagus clarus]
MNNSNRNLIVKPILIDTYNTTMSSQAKEAAQKAADATVQKQHAYVAAREIANICSDSNSVSSNSSTSSSAVPSLTNTYSTSSSSSYPRTEKCKNLLLIVFS